MKARFMACACALVLFLLFRCIGYAADSNRCDTRTATEPVLCGMGSDDVVFAAVGDDSRQQEQQRKEHETAPENQAAFLSALVLQVQRLKCAHMNRCETHTAEDPVLCSYEPNTVGFTKDRDDSGFIDFKLSLQYQLFPQVVTGILHWLHDTLPISDYPAYNSAVYFAFTGRFGQYLGTRDSSPVVGKRFNPKLFYRIWTDRGHDEYLDFTFLGHESNGQSIDSTEEYQAALSTKKKPEIANDQLSRGWDYLEVIWKKILKKVEDQRTLSSYVVLKHFMHRGPLQKGAEEYNMWENNPEGKPRNYVNGLAGMLKFHEQGTWLTLRSHKVLNDVKVVLAYETGTHKPFRYSTGRFEFGTKLLMLPVSIWTQRGYNSDLAQYFKRVNSYGVQVEIGSF